MRPFGVVLLILLLYIFIKNSKFSDSYIKILALTICTEAFINVGYLFKIASYELQYSEFLVALLGILSLVQITRSKLNRKMGALGCLLIGSIVISNILLVVIPYDNPIITFGMEWNNFFMGHLASAEFSAQTVKMSLRIVIYILIAIASESLMTDNYLQATTYRFIHFGFVVVSFGYIEFIIKNIFQSNALSRFNAWFFGISDSTLEVLIERSSTFALQGFMREPAHFASALFTFGLVLIISDKENKSWGKLLAASFVMLLSRSLSGIIYLVVLSGIYTVVNKKKLAYLISAILVAPLIIFSNYFSYYIERLGNIFQLFMTFEMDRTMSEHFRIISSFENLKIFAERPFFGIGMGTTYAFSFLPTLLASIGVFGFVLWFIFIFIGIAKVKRNVNNFIIIFLLVICWTFTGSISNAYSMPLLLLALILRYNRCYSNAVIIKKNITSQINQKNWLFVSDENAD